MSDCGMSCVFRGHRHGRRRARGAVARPGPATFRPTASMTCGGRPSSFTPEGRSGAADWEARQ
eukprot:7629757-Lingulodinium_polyedra.AAC.1